MHLLVCVYVYILIRAVPNIRFEFESDRIVGQMDYSASSPGPRKPAIVAVAMAGVRQPLSNFKFATVNSFVSKLFEFELYSAEY